MESVCCDVELRVDGVQQIFDGNDNLTGENSSLVNKHGIVNEGDIHDF